MPPFKSVEQYERESKWVRGCLVHPNVHSMARVVYQKRHGMLQPGWDQSVCHTCDNPKCILDAHHFIGTQEDNIKDSMDKGRIGGPQWLAERSKIMKRAWQRPETQKRMRAARKKSHSKPAYRARASEISKVQTAKAAWKLAHAKAIKKAWKEGAYATRTTPAYRRHLSSAIKRAWAAGKYGKGSVASEERNKKR